MNSWYCMDLIHTKIEYNNFKFNDYELESWLISRVEIKEYRLVNKILRNSVQQK